MERTEGKVGYEWPLNLVEQPIDWVYQRCTMAAIFDRNNDLVAVLPQKQAKYIFSILNSQPALLAACKEALPIIAGERILFDNFRPKSNLEISLAKDIQECEINLEQAIAESKVK